MGSVSAVFLSATWGTEGLMFKMKKGKGCCEKHTDYQHRLLKELHEIDRSWGNTVGQFVLKNSSGKSEAEMNALVKKQCEVVWMKEVEEKKNNDKEKKLMQ